MKCLVAINPDMIDKKGYQYLGAVEFGTTKVHLGEIELSQPEFDANSPHNKDYLLLRVNSFSCNYRDKALLLFNYQKIKEAKRFFLPFGSEFSAEVIAIGSGVSEFKVGDKVMGDCAYPDNGTPGILPGVVTNFASLGWQRIHKRKLIKIPLGLEDSEASCFSLGAQTAAAMIRRSGILAMKGNPLVLSGRSATSLFVIQQLIAYGYKPFVFSTSDWTQEEKEMVHPAEVRVIKKEIRYDDVIESGITHVFDPFFDMNLSLAMQYLKMNGTYVTCGLRDQHPLLSEEIPKTVEPIVRLAVAQAILKNITIKGNCLGETKDLENAIDLFHTKGCTPIIDKIYALEQSLDFVKNTFFNKKKFGKIVLCYK